MIRSEAGKQDKSTQTHSKQEQKQTNKKNKNNDLKSPKQSHKQEHSHMCLKVPNKKKVDHRTPAEFYLLFFVFVNNSMT